MYLLLKSRGFQTGARQDDTEAVILSTCIKDAGIAISHSFFILHGLDMGLRGLPAVGRTHKTEVDPTIVVGGLNKYFLSLQPICNQVASGL